MTVVAGWFAGKIWPTPPPLEELPETLQADIKLNSSLNSKVCKHASPAMSFIVNEQLAAMRVDFSRWSRGNSAIEGPNAAFTPVAILLSISLVIGVPN
jgi:hypothetical protein